MSESECRHLPEPVWDPARCGKCGATLRGPVDARLLAAAKAVLDSLGDESYLDTHVENQLSLAVAIAERGQQAWTSERPTVPTLCPDCGGKGGVLEEPGLYSHVCSTCHGAGAIAPPIATEQEGDGG